MYLERFKLDGRVAVVTGGAQAIGFACVEALAEGGAHVYIADRNPAAGKEAQAALDAKGVQVDFIEMDVTDPRPSTPPRRTNASKAGVHHLTKSLAAEWGARGIRVNAVVPTYINTPMTSYAKQNKAMFDTWMSNTPMGRMGEVDEIAAVVLFLASDAASLMTGSIVAADGRIYLLVEWRAEIARAPFGSSSSDDMVRHLFDGSVLLRSLENLCTVTHHDEAVADHEGVIEVMRDQHARSALLLEVPDIPKKMLCLADG